MEIQKIFNSEYDNDRLYSVLMSEEEYDLFQRAFTYTGLRYDQTDAYKQMKDSDILAERKKSNMGSYIKTAQAGGVGAAIGTVGGAIAGGIMARKSGVLKGIKSGMKAGAIAGAGLGAATGYIGTSKERADNNFANERLDQAKRYAYRREKKDWKNNMVNRDGYTY